MTTTATATPTPDIDAPEPALPGFGRLIKGELLKIRTTNAWWLLALAGLAFTGLALLINLFQAHQNLHFDPNLIEVKPGEPGPGEVPPGDPGFPSEAERRAVFDARLHAQLIKEASNVFTSGQFFGLMLVMLLGVLIVTNEFHHQTATATFLATPHRTKVIAGKLTTGIMVGAAAACVTMAISVLVGSLFFSAWGFDSPLGESGVLKAMSLNLLTYSIWIVIGIGLGVLIRSQVGATVTASVLYLPGTYLSFIAIIGIHYLIDKDWVYKAAVILPTLASAQLIDGAIELDGVFLPDRWVAAVVLIGWGLLFAVIGTLITRKRDIS